MFPILLLSPSKTLNEPRAQFFDSSGTQPKNRLASANLGLTLELLKALKGLNRSQLREYYGISESIAGKLEDYYSDAPPIQPVWTWYTGEAFKYLDLSSLETQGGKGWARATSHLVILSSLYGAHRPGDLMQPYRLDFTLPPPPGFESNGPKSLRALWESSVRDYFQDLAQQLETKTIISCASDEFESMMLSALDANQGSGLPGGRSKTTDPEFEMYTIEFYQRHPKTGAKTKISARAKQARGAFVRWVLEQAPDGFASTREMKEFITQFKALEYGFESEQPQLPTTGFSMSRLVFSQ